MAVAAVEEDSSLDCFPFPTHTHARGYLFVFPIRPTSRSIRPNALPLHQHPPFTHRASLTATTLSLYTLLPLTAARLDLTALAVTVASTPRRSIVPLSAPKNSCFCQHVAFSFKHCVAQNSIKNHNTATTQRKKIRCGVAVLRYTKSNINCL